MQQLSPGVRRRRRAGLALFLTTLAGGGLLVVDSAADVGRTPPRPAATDAFTGPMPPTGPVPGVHPLPFAPPTRITIPTIGIDAPLTGLTLDNNDTLQPPPTDDKNLAGWFQDGPAPGSPGTAVIAGHLDTHTGPAVFYRIGHLHKKDTIKILREDGRTALFTIDAVEQYEKSDFPSHKVYAQTKRPELRLITCAGTFTKNTSYSANIVVYAHLTNTPPEPKP